MSDVVERFASLFAGRTDAWGTESGGCRRVGDVGVAPYHDHLHGGEPIGVYPMVPVYSVPTNWWEVKWGCIDLDVKGPTHATGYDAAGAALDAAQNLTTALRALGITGWIERTKSGGYHVWVFAAEWVPAATMRRALLVACAVVEVPPTEVNPKSEGYDDPATLGNYVRLPYPGHLSGMGESGGARSALDLRGPEPLPAPLLWFVTQAELSLASTDTLTAAAALHMPSRPDRTLVLTGEIDLDDALRRRLGGLTITILRDGPLDGGDRSGALFKLAHCCREDDLTAEEALAVVTAADLAWGKYHHRHDGDRYLRQTVERAWS